MNWWAGSSCSLPTMAAAGVADGDYVLGGQAVIVQEGRAYLRNEDGSTGSLAGAPRICWMWCATRGVTVDCR
ncbi:hypothetical protein [Mobiluncus mulieris]|uniref:hypothetical protein n=1 Tax=Mobiluncus mulieris TaxID=2052 RepID=UPI002092D965|nr:hypothetical protein [Mobiluncus mulieris]